MKLVLILLVLLAGIVACAKKENRAQLRSDEEYRKLDQPGPAAGRRAEFVSPVALLPDPAKYSGKRVILEGVWSSGFEHSNLDLENSAQDFRIWVDVDWSKVDGPMGDFSRRKEREEKGETAKADRHGYVAQHIVAEGTFYYRKASIEDGVPGFGHMSGSPGYFLIDRLFQYDPEERNAQPTPEGNGQEKSGGGGKR